MYVSRRDHTIAAGAEGGFGPDDWAYQASLRSAAGLRWAMILRSVADPRKVVALAMWQTQEQAERWNDTSKPGDPSSAPQVYDVTTARGSMTPCSHAAIVDWSVDEADRANFVNLWNAAFHHVEDRIGSRLLQDVGRPATLAGLHVATDHDQPSPETLAAAIKLSEGLTIRPSSVEHFEVVSLFEP
jgi:hypothetical protein